MNEIVRSYRSVGNSFGVYWRLYGGFGAVVRSPYLHAAAAVSLLCWWQWYHAAWFEVVIQVLPNIIGFSIGAFAIWLGFGDDNFRRIFAERESGQSNSSYLTVTASFAHFVVVQIAALLLAVIGKALAFDPATVPAVAAIMAATGYSPHIVSHALGALGGFIGFWAFAYALILGVATVFGIMRLAQTFQKYADTRTNGGPIPIATNSREPQAMSQRGIGTEQRS